MKNGLWLVAAGFSVSVTMQAGNKVNSHADNLAGNHENVEAVIYDSTHVQRLQEVLVKGVRLQKDAPFAVANVRGKELNAFSSTGKELPFLFDQTPGVLAWSENGLGTGTTHLRIRGAADSRINITLDGVPLNSPEDQCVFWANMNSYGALLGSAQIQRGVGSSTNGDGAFGGTVSLTTKTVSQVPMLELSGSYGSYNTYNLGGNFSTGLLGNHLVFDGAYHETNTDGFIHGTSGRSGSYYGGLTWLDDKFQISYKNVGNFEKTGQAWNGVTAGNDDLSLMDGTYGANTGIRTYKDLYNAGLGRYNSLYEQLVTDDKGNFVKDANGNYTTERYKMNDGSYWDKATDNFWQNHNILSAVFDISKHWTATASLHYTHGYGYYKEFKNNYKIKKFGLTADDGTSKSDFVRKKGLSQNAFGAVGSVNYKDDAWDVIGGFSVQKFNGNHFGYLTYISNAALNKKYMGDGEYKYYDSDAHKFDGSVYAKASYSIDKAWKVFADMQYRHVSYKTDGVNDKFYKQSDGTYTNQRLDINEKYDFFNPKAGISFSQDGHRAYASVAFSHREPERNNFTDNGSYPAPKAESLMDYELGYDYTAETWHAGVNLYYMDYDNQFVQTGAQSDIGENLTTNIKSSYRMGVEITAGWNPLSWLTLEGNAALSQNKIKDFDEMVEDWDDWDGNTEAAKYHCDGNGDGYRQIHYDNSTLAFSPSVILNGFVNLHWNGLQAIWHTNYVSRQYLDNTENADRALPCYAVTNVNLNYTLNTKKWVKALKEVVFGVDFNNIFNRRYASGGWVYSAIAESSGHTNDNRYYQIGYVPMSGFTAMGHITLRF
jgi:iron complex outermembrane receptor protein